MALVPGHLSSPITAFHHNGHSASSPRHLLHPAKVQGCASASGRSSGRGCGPDRCIVTGPVDCTSWRLEPEEEPAEPSSEFTQKQQSEENQVESWGIGAEARVKAQNYCKTPLSAILLSVVSVTQVNRSLKILNEKFHK